MKSVAELLSTSAFVNLLEDQFFFQWLYIVRDQMFSWSIPFVSFFPDVRKTARLEPSKSQANDVVSGGI